MKFIQFIKRNLLIISAFIFFIFLGVVYINRSYIDIPYLDGLMPLPMVDKYFQGNLSFADISMHWGEHRLIGYGLIFLFNAVFFGLNMKLEPFIFLLSDFFIGLILYFCYKRFLNGIFGNKLKNWSQLSYLPMLFLIFSLVHPPGMLMTTQFVVGTLFFILVISFFDRIMLGSKKWLDLILFIFLFFIYIFIFSGANFGGMLLGFTICYLLKIFLPNKKRFSPFLLISILFSVLLVVGYLFFNRVDQDGVGLIGKILIYFSRPRESFLAILSGISATTLDIHTYEELFRSKDAILLINGSVLFLLGIYSIFKFIFLKVYKFTYIPLLLIFYSVGFMLITRLGRLNGGWKWPMNDWYSFHLYFYLIGILWILVYDIFKKYSLLSIKSFRYLLKKNSLTLIIFSFSILWIFSFQLVSNLTQWHRGPYVKEWLETKRMAFLNPTNESIETLLWPKNDSLAAIRILKDHKLSVFRNDGYLDKQNGVIKLSGWNSDGWISKNAMARITGGQKGFLLINVYLPKETFLKVYKDSLELQITINGKIVKEQSFSSNSFSKGSVDVILNVPQNESFSFELKLNKFFVPSYYGLGNDSRELGIMVNKIENR